MKKNQESHNEKPHCTPRNQNYPRLLQHTAVTSSCFRHRALECSGWSRRGLAGWLCFRPQAWPSQLCFTFCSGQLLGLPISWQDLRHKGQVQIYKCTSKPAWITLPNLLPSETNHMAELLEGNFVSKLGLSSEVKKTVMSRRSLNSKKIKR